MLSNITILMSGLLQSRNLLFKNKLINQFSSLARKQVKSTNINGQPELLKRTYIKVKFTKVRNVNTNLKPFSLFDKKPFILPTNQFSLVFSQLIRAFTVRLEMARIDSGFNIQEFHRGVQMVSKYMLCLININS